MKIENTAGFFSAMTSICCMLLMPACATGEDGMDVPGELADSDDAQTEEDADETQSADESQQDEPATEPQDSGPPGDDLPTDEPPADDPPTDDPPTDDPPADDPPTDGPQQAEADGDHQSNPAVLAQFRYTSPAPTSVGTPLFNEDAIDTKGLQYLGEVSNPGDQEDWIQFSIVPGDNDPVIGLFLDCDTPDLTPQPVRAHLLDENGEVLATVSCGDDEAMVTLHNASSVDEYFVRIDVMDGSEHFDAYTMEIDAHCFGGCNYQPYEG